jgi:hypothetical protein
MAWVSVKIKFATNEAQAMHAIRRAVFSELAWVVQSLCIGYIGLRWYAGAPVTRFEVVLIALLIFWSFLVIVLILAFKLAELGEKHLEETVKLFRRVEAIEEDEKRRG